MRFYFICLFVSVFLLSCKEDFDIAAEKKDIPVVYGLLSRQDTAHYIKVERAFLVPGRSAFEIAPVSYTHLRAHETVLDLVCRLLLEKKKTKNSLTRYFNLNPSCMHDGGKHCARTSENSNDRVAHR